jgi:hypothetical protein
MRVIIMLLGTIDLQDTERWPGSGLDQYIDSGNDSMLGIKRRWNVAIRFIKVADDHWLAGHECATLR